jgi:mRNA interferase MazF
MAGFSRGDVVKVPFPYTDRSTRQSRPALVVSSNELEDLHGLLWVLLITSAANRGWPGDVAINVLSGTGLPVASIVRTAKIATIEARDAVNLGKLPSAIWRKVQDKLALETGHSGNR